jgi:coenzyme F420-reducing hydrogenase alpha subunit
MIANDSLVMLLLIQASTLEQKQQREMFKNFNLSERAMDYCLACLTYLSKQSKKLTANIQIGQNKLYLYDKIDIDKSSVTVEAIKALVTNCDNVDEKTRVQQMRAILLAGSDHLSHRKYRSAFFSKELSDGEKLLIDVGAMLDPSKKEFELKDVTPEMREVLQYQAAVDESEEMAMESDDEEEDIVQDEGKTVQPEKIAAKSHVAKKAIKAIKSPDEEPSRGPVPGLGGSDENEQL